MEDEYHFETQAIHKGQEPDETFGAITPPIHMSATFRQENISEHTGYVYSRTGNPNRAQLETIIASLEGAKYGLGFASGSSATTSIQLSMQKGDHVICGEDVYAGTFRLFSRVMSNFGIEYSFVDTSDVRNIKDNIKSNTKLIWFETPTNPLIRISDIEQISKLAKENEILTVVDNTFASPYIQHPIKLGVDVVMHSATKYLSGHSDLISGVLVTNNEELYEKFKFVQNTAGAVPSPFDCWLVLRGLKTLPLRMEKHSSNAEKVVKYLETKDKVSKIYYPLYPKHKGYEIAKRQMSLGGGMVSFELNSDKAGVHKFLENLKLISLGESLGGVKSLCEYPSEMTHSSIPEARQKEVGITPGLIRFSVGIENSNDIIADLEKGFQSIKS